MSSLCRRRFSGCAARLKQWFTFHSMTANGSLCGTLSFHNVIPAVGQITKSLRTVRTIPGNLASGFWRTATSMPICVKSYKRLFGRTSLVRRPHACRLTISFSVRTTPSRCPDKTTARTFPRWHPIPSLAAYSQAVYQAYDVRQPWRSETLYAPIIRELFGDRRS